MYLNVNTASAYRAIINAAMRTLAAWGFWGNLSYFVDVSGTALLGVLGSSRSFSVDAAAVGLSLPGAHCAAGHGLCRSPRDARSPRSHPAQRSAASLAHGKHVGSLRICAAWAEISLPNCAAADVWVGLVKASSWLVL